MNRESAFSIIFFALLVAAFLSYVGVTAWTGNMFFRGNKPFNAFGGANLCVSPFFPNPINDPRVSFWRWPFTINARTNPYIYIGWTALALIIAFRTVLPFEELIPYTVGTAGLISLGLFALMVRRTENGWAGFKREYYQKDAQRLLAVVDNYSREQKCAQKTFNIELDGQLETYDPRSGNPPEDHTEARKMSRRVEDWIIQTERDCGLGKVWVERLWLVLCLGLMICGVVVAQTTATRELRLFAVACATMAAFQFLVYFTRRMDLPASFRALWSWLPIGFLSTGVMLGVLGVWVLATSSGVAVGVVSIVLPVVVLVVLQIAKKKQ